MENCGGHGTDIPLAGLCIETLPANSTSKYQPLDLGLIAHSKIWYRSLFLQNVVEKTLHRASNEHDFPAHSHSRKFGLRDGQMPHVGDAMDLFNDCSSKTECKTMMKCWMKSKCLSNLQVQECKQMVAHDNTPEVTVYQDEAGRIYDDIFVQGLMSPGEFSTNELIQEYKGVESANQHCHVFNAPTPDDISIDRPKIAETHLQSLFDAQSDRSNSPSSQSTSVFGADTEPAKVHFLR